MDNRCQDILLQQFGTCLSSTLVDSIMSMDGRTSGSKVWPGPEPGWQMLIRIFWEPSKLLACQELKGTPFLRSFQAFVVRSWQRQEQVYLSVFWPFPQALQHLSLKMPSRGWVQFPSWASEKPSLDKDHIMKDRSITCSVGSDWGGVFFPCLSYLYPS